MKRLKIDKKQASANLLPLDCWGIISSYLSSERDFVLLCTTIRGFHQYASTLNVNCANSVEFQIAGKRSMIALEKTNRLIPYVKKLSIPFREDFKGYEFNKLIKNVRHYFPNVLRWDFSQKYHCEKEDILVTGFNKLELLDLYLSEKSDSTRTSNSLCVKIQNNLVLNELIICTDPSSVEFQLNNLPKLENLEAFNVERITSIDEEIRQNIKKLSLATSNVGSIGINTMKNLTSLKVDLETLSKSSIRRIFSESLKELIVEEENVGFVDNFEHAGVTVEGIETLERIDLYFPSAFLDKNPELFQFRNLPNVKHFMILNNANDELDDVFSNAQLTINENWEKLETFKCIGFNVEFLNLVNTHASLRSLKLGIDDKRDYGTIKVDQGFNAHYFPPPYSSARDLDVELFQNLEKLKLYQFQGSFVSNSNIGLSSLVSLSIVVCRRTQHLLKFNGDTFPKLKKLKIALPYVNLKTFDLSYYMGFKHLEEMTIKFWQRLPRGSTKADKDKRIAVMKKRLPSSSKFVISEKFFPSLKVFRLETCNSIQLVFSVVKIMMSKKIEHCEINGADTVLVNNCSSLKQLWVQRCKDLTIVGCPKLSVLDCRFTKIAYLEFEDSWKNSLKKLTILNKNEQRLACVMPSVIGFKKLHSVKLKNFFVKSFEHLPMLNYLEFSITKDFSRTIEDLPSLENIHVCSHVMDYQSIFLKNLPKLKSFKWAGDERLDVQIDEISSSNLRNFGKY